MGIMTSIVANFCANALVDLLKIIGGSTLVTASEGEPEVSDSLCFYMWWDNK